MKGFLLAIRKFLKDPLIRSSLLQFGLLFAAVLTFVLLTTQHVITPAPEKVVPPEYQGLVGHEAIELSAVDLEQALRNKSPEIQGLVFFDANDGVKSVVVLGNGFERDRFVPQVDTDEIRSLAKADGIAIINEPYAVKSDWFSLLPGWWMWAVAGFVVWLAFLLGLKRDGGDVPPRGVILWENTCCYWGHLLDSTKMPRRRLFSIIVCALVVTNGLLFSLHCYDDRHLMVMPSQLNSAPRAESWQVTRYLEKHPEKFQRVSYVEELQSAYVILSIDKPSDNNAPVQPAPAPTAQDKTPKPSADPSPMAAAIPMAIAAMGVAPMGVVAPAAHVVAQVVKPAEANQQAGDKAIAQGKQITLERTIHFPNTPEGQTRFREFIGKIHAEKIEAKAVPPVRESGYFQSMTLAGGIVFGVFIVVTIGFFIYTLAKWDEWGGGDGRPLEFAANGVTAGGGSYTGVRNKAKIREEDKKTFADVAGCDEAVEEMRIVLRKILRPRLYRVFGAPVPSGIILHGPPGTGKTLLARALAGEAGGSFQALSGSEFVEMYVGVGAKRVREAYAKARSDARRTGRVSFVFIDEIDAIGKKRGNNTEGGAREYEQTLNQLLVEMQGFANHGLVCTIGATNRLDILDDALLRPGRFDIKIQVPKPDRKGRGLIFRIYLRKLKLVLVGETAEEKKTCYDSLIDNLSRRSHDFSGAEIEGAVKNGATIAVERQFGDATEDLTPEQVEEYREMAIITLKDLHEGVDKMAYGTQIKSRVRTDKERKATAVHEAGHAAVPTVEGGDPVNRITIVMTDKSLGLMDSSPEEGERYDWTREQFEIRLRTMLAGRAAEKIILGKISTGASNDFERASLLARQMVGIYGMSKELGVKSLPLDQHGFPTSNIGETLMVKFNNAWGDLIDRAEKETDELITAHRVQIEACADKLYDEETMTGDDFRQLWKDSAPVAVAPVEASSLPQGSAD